MIQYTDLDVTKIKFEKEIQEFKLIETEYRKRGVICTKVEFPCINLLFAVPHIQPSPIAFAVKIDYTNWDSEPPSVKIINPFTDEIINRQGVRMQFLQWNKSNNSAQDILVGDENPFFCIKGIKEYHMHPAHSGDSWLLHRTRGEGKLSDLIEKLMKYSVAQAGGYLIIVNDIKMNFPNLIIGTDTNRMKR